MQSLLIICLLLFFSNVSSLCYPGDCGNGYCSLSDYECKCDTNYFTDNDPCDTQATQLQKGKYAQSDIDAYEWAYFYIPLTGIQGPIKLDFRVKTYEIFAYYQVKSADDYDLPDDSDNYDGSCKALSGVENICQISFSLIKQEKNGVLVVSVLNKYDDDNDIKIWYSITTDDDKIGTASSSGSSVRSIIIGCAVAAGIIFVIALCVWRRVKMRRMRFRANQRAAHRGRASGRAQNDAEEEGNLNENQADPNPNYAPVLNPNQLQMLVHNPQNQNNAVPAQPHNHHAPQAQPQPQAQAQNPNQGQVQPPQVQPAQNQARRQGAQSDLLTKEEIRKYFPKQAFSKLEQPFPMTACSICLEEFRTETVCHQLYCFHIFHEACIEAWLAKHDSCPDCRKPITRKAVKEFLRAERKRKEQEQRVNKVKIMNSSIRASKPMHKAQAQGTQRRGSNHDIHAPPQQDMHAPRQQDLHVPPQQDMHAPPLQDLHAPPRDMHAPPLEP